MLLKLLFFKFPGIITIFNELKASVWSFLITKLLVILGDYELSKGFPDYVSVTKYIDTITEFRSLIFTLLAGF